MNRLLATAVLILFVAPIQTWAQNAPINLSSDGAPTTVRGHVNPLSSTSYRFNVTANQRIAIHLTSTSAKRLVKFNVSRNKYAADPLPGTDAVTDWEGTLKVAGDYWISVFALPAANEENFTLVISLPTGKRSDASTTPENGSIDVTKIPKTGSMPQNFVPSGWEIAARAEGDLNGDGRADQVLQLVTADTPTDRSASDAAPEAHSLLILLTDGGAFRRSGVATKLLIPIAPQYSLDLMIRNGVLTVKQAYGMSDVINLTHVFRLEPETGRFLLIGRDVFTYTRPLSDDTIKTSENYLTGVRLITTGHFRRATGTVAETTKREQIERKKVYLEDVDTDAGGE